MANINAIANLYLFALCFAGITVYLYVLYLQNHSWKNRFFWLPFIHFIAAGIFITLQLNILLLPVTNNTTLEGLEVTLYVVDAISTVAFGWALFLRMQLLLGAAVRVGKIKPWHRYLSFILVFPACFFPVSAIIGITCLFNESLASRNGGELCQDITNACNMAFLAAEITMHFIFAETLLEQATMAPAKLKQQWIIGAVLLAIIPLLQLAGSIYAFWDTFVGTAITYTFWFIDNSAFLLMNRMLSKGFKSYSSNMSVKMIPRAEVVTADSSFISTNRSQDSGAS